MGWTAPDREVKGGHPGSAAWPAATFADYRLQGTTGHMAGTKNHDYHILPPDIHPFLVSMLALGTA